MAKKLVTYGIICQIAFSLYAYYISHAPAPNFLKHKEIYEVVFSPYLKFSIASSISIWIGSWVNIAFLTKLTEYYGGKYFALRSFLSSTIAELIVTVISMLIANFNRMDLESFIFMTICCFLTKTLISFFAIFPAAVIVDHLQNNKASYLSIQNIKNPINYFKNLLFIIWYTRSYIYNLESINLDTRKVCLHYKGTRGVVNITFNKLILDSEITNKCKPSDASKIGYHYSKTIRNSHNDEFSFFKEKNKKTQTLQKGKWDIISLRRDGKLNIACNMTQITFSKFPNELFERAEMINKFPSSQALYIGYLAGLDSLERERTPAHLRHLRLVM